jgi:predicted lysophospholipase L1 biosynthesis ABC-type transport system permease subunit
MAQLRVYKVEQHLQHVQLPTVVVVTVAQELQVAQAVIQSVATAVSAMTQVAASALMEHLHVKQPEAVSTTTVALLPSQ